LRPQVEGNVAEHLTVGILFVFTKKWFWTDTKKFLNDIKICFLFHTVLMLEDDCQWETINIWRLETKQNNHKTEFEFEKVTESFIDAIYIEK
jgi:hypothetical protein